MTNGAGRLDGRDQPAGATLPSFFPRQAGQTSGVDVKDRLRARRGNIQLPAGGLSLIRQYGKARRIWLMDRGIPTEATLALIRANLWRNTVAAHDVEMPTSPTRAAQRSPSPFMRPR